MRNYINSSQALLPYYVIPDGGMNWGHWLVKPRGQAGQEAGTRGRFSQGFQPSWLVQNRIRNTVTETKKKYIIYIYSRNYIGKKVELYSLCVVFIQILHHNIKKIGRVDYKSTYRSCTMPKILLVNPGPDPGLWTLCKHSSPVTLYQMLWGTGSQGSWAGQGPEQGEMHQSSQPTLSCQGLKLLHTLRGRRGTPLYTVQECAPNHQYQFHLVCMYKKHCK